MDTRPAVPQNQDMRKAEAKREKMVGVWLTAEEHEHLRALAFEARKAIATYVRDVVLASKPTKKR